MKWNVDTVENGSFEVEVPAEIQRGLPSLGEEFELKFRPLVDLKEGEEHQWKTVSCLFVGDGKSLLVGNNIVRLSTQPTRLKRGKLRLRAAVQSIARDHRLVAKPVRPVEPKVTTASLGGGPLPSPITGKVIAIPIKVGQAVKEGDVLLVIEAMKMENQIKAECDGTVEDVQVKEGQAVSVDEVLLTIKPFVEPPK